MADGTLASLADWCRGAARSLPRETRLAIVGLSATAVALAVRHITDMHAVDTGATRASIHGQVLDGADGTELLVGPTTSYAPAIEFGTARMEARPFMTATARDLAGGIAQQVIERAVQRALR